MATGMESELVQLLKQQQESWTNFLTALVAKLELLETGSSAKFKADFKPTDSEANFVKNHTEIVNLEEDIQTEADFIPICDAQPARAAITIEGNVVSYPESVQPSIQHPQQQRMLSNPNSISCLYVSKSKRNEERPAIQYSKRTIVTQKKDWRMRSEYFSILQKDIRTNYSHAHRQHSLSQKLSFSMQTRELYTHSIPRTIACLHSIKNVMALLKLTFCRLLLSICLWMHCKLKMRQTHQIHQPFKVGLESGVASDSTDVIFFHFF